MDDVQAQDELAADGYRFYASEAQEFADISAETFAEVLKSPFSWIETALEDGLDYDAGTGDKRS